MGGWQPRVLCSVGLCGLFLAACSGPDRPDAVALDTCIDSFCPAAGAGGASSDSFAESLAGAAGTGNCEPDPEAGVTWTGDVLIAEGPDLREGVGMSDGTVEVAYLGSRCGFVSATYDPNGDAYAGDGSGIPKWELSGMAVGSDFLRLTPSGVTVPVHSVLIPAEPSGDADITGAISLPTQATVDEIYESTGISKEEETATILGWVANADSISYDTYIRAPSGTVVYMGDGGWSRGESFLTPVSFFAVLNVGAAERPGTPLSLEALQIAATENDVVSDQYSVTVERDSVTWLPVTVTDYNAF